MSSRFHPLPPGFVPPCLPKDSKAPPTGKEWLHEIKHDGFRVIARKMGNRVKLYSRSGNDLTRRFPLIAGAIAKLRASSCIIDGEAVACADNGIACFELLLHWDIDRAVLMYAFDLIELNGDDFRREPLQMRKAKLETVLSRPLLGIRFNEHIEEDGPIVFQRACRLGLEGIVSKRKGSQYISGRCRHWIKLKNPDAPAVRREAEIDWSR